MIKSKLLAAMVVGGLFVTATTAGATTMTYNNRAAFEAALDTSITDDYSNPGYMFIQSDADMSAVLGETSYSSTAFTDLNIVTATENYCAGCNGSFRLTFTSTSVGDATGVFGIGFDIEFLDDSSPYSAFVTFGDLSTQNYVLPDDPGFFGITDDMRSIRSIHVAFNDVAATNGYIEIDNLTIGNAPDSTAVPEPGTLTLFGLGLAGLGFARRRKAVA